MLISRKHKALILRLRNPELITTIIPKAKVFMHNGKEFVAVRHGVEEVKVLRNIGIDAPSPIEYYYNWPGRFAPFHAQRATAEFLSYHNRAFVLNDLGTGKTLATLWGYDFLRSQGVVTKALVISPLSTLERTWADEIFNHFPHLTCAVLHGSREKRLALLAQDVDLYLINHDGIKVPGLEAALALRPDINLVIVDEVAQVARTAGADRYKTLRNIVNKQAPRAVWGLTGTPTPNKPTDAWAQCALVAPGSVPPYFKQFRDMVERQVSNFVWLPRPEAQQVVFNAMQPAIRFTRDECVDLPPCIYESREAPLSDPQKKAYKDMLNKLKAEAESGEITAVNEAVKAQKLIQIACGVAYDKDSEEVVFDPGPRLQLVRDVVDEARSKVIIFVPFVSVVSLVSQYLRDKGYTVECIHGGVSKSERDRIFGAFQKTSTPQILVAQPAAMSHGLTLTAASTIVWYAPVTSNDTFQQANARITRPGQKHTQVIVMIEGTDMERKYYRRLKDKERIQGILLDMVQSDRLTA